MATRNLTSKTQTSSKRMARKSVYCAAWSVIVTCTLTLSTAKVCHYLSDLREAEANVNGFARLCLGGLEQNLFKISNSSRARACSLMKTKFFYQAMKSPFCRVSDPSTIINAVCGPYDRTAVAVVPDYVSDVHKIALSMNGSCRNKLVLDSGTRYLILPRSHACRWIRAWNELVRLRQLLPGACSEETLTIIENIVCVTTVQDTSTTAPSPTYFPGTIDIKCRIEDFIQSCLNSPDRAAPLFPIGEPLEHFCQQMRNIDFEYALKDSLRCDVDKYNDLRDTLCALFTTTTPPDVISSVTTPRDIMLSSATKTPTDVKSSVTTTPHDVISSVPTSRRWHRYIQWTTYRTRETPQNGHASKNGEYVTRRDGVIATLSSSCRNSFSRTTAGSFRQLAAVHACTVMRSTSYRKYVTVIGKLCTSLEYDKLQDVICGASMYVLASSIAILCTFAHLIE